MQYNNNNNDNDVLHLMAQGEQMMSAIKESYFAFASAYNFTFSDTYDPTVPMCESTNEFCRVILNCYFIADNHYRRALHFNSRTHARPRYFYKNITRDGCPSIRPNVLFLSSTTSLINFVKNLHNEFFVVDIREFLTMLCIVYVHLPTVRAAHPSVAFLFEECMYNQAIPRLPLAARTIIWPFSRYFSCDLFTKEAQMSPDSVCHRFSFYTLMYLCVFCISEVVKHHDPLLFHRAVLDFQCANFDVCTLADAESTIDFGIIASNLACDEKDFWLPTQDVLSYMREIVAVALAVRFRYNKHSNDAVVFLQYDARVLYPCPNRTGHAATNGNASPFSSCNGTDVLTISFRNAFHGVIFSNVADTVLRRFPMLKNDFERVAGHFQLSVTMLKIIHMASVCLCTSQRTRWFSGIMPIYPLVARILLDTPSNPSLADAILVWVAMLAWLNLLFGNKKRFATCLHAPFDLCSAIRHFTDVESCKSPTAFLRALFVPTFNLPDILPNVLTTISPKIKDQPITSPASGLKGQPSSGPQGLAAGGGDENAAGTHYKHSQARVWPLYESVADKDHPIAAALFALEQATCRVCREYSTAGTETQGTKRRATQCREYRMQGLPRTFFDFAVYVGSGQEEGSPINPKPTTENCMMAIVPNKFCKEDERNGKNFCPVFANALYPILAQHEILPKSWNFTL